MAGIRDQIFSTYGEDFSLRLGFARQTPRRHVELVEYVEYLVESLSRPGISMPEPAPGRLRINLGEQLALLVPLCESLKDARDGYHVARREAQEALAARNEAVEAFDADYPWLAGGFESQLRMAGLKPLAAAVRPSSRRKGLIAWVAGEVAVLTLLHHSDRGSQYASRDHQQILKDRQITCSVSHRGNCWDNAVVESFFGTLKTELLARRPWPTKWHVRSKVSEYLSLYNGHRRHSSLGYLSPNQFEALEQQELYVPA